MPAQSSRSFTPKGTPASGPRSARGVASTAVGGSKGAVGVEVHEGVERTVALVDRSQAQLDELACGGGAIGDEGGRIEDGWHLHGLGR